MTKQEFIDAVHKKTESLDLTKTAVKEVIDTAFEVMVKAIKKDEKFTVPGFGTFNLRTRKARTGRNPQTKEPMKIKASKTIGFKPSPSVKDSL